jgi:hypothetical protein
VSWLDYASKSASTKLALAHLFPREKVRAWTLVSGTVYQVNPRAFISAVHNGTTALTSVTGTPAVSEWSYDPITNLLLINTGADPRGQDIILTYKYCFSTAPIVLPHDLDQGAEVEYDARVLDIGDLKLELDYENAGIALESTSSISLQNNDGFFDDIYDTLTWENQVVRFYSTGLELDPAESRLIFTGFIDQKSFSTQQFKLTIKDAFKKLRDRASLPVFSTLDGDLNDSELGKSKRRIYGRLKNLRCVGIDKTLSGFSLAGTFSANVGDTTIIGTGSNLLDELSPEDEISYVFNGTEFKYKVQTVPSDTSFTVSQPIEAPLISASLICSPSVPYRRKNRAWHIAGHLCHDIETTVTEFITPTRLRVASTQDLMPGDLLDYDNGDQFLNVLRISGDVVVLDSAVSGVPTGGEPLVSPAVRAAYFENSLLVPGRDYVVLNGASDCILELDELAEFNITRPFLTSVNFTFTNGSSSVTHNTPDFDLKTILKPRDWIRANSITRPTWFEILSVDSTSLTLRVPYSEASFTGNAERKNVTYVSDDSLITVDVNGKRGSDGRWAKTASQAIADILLLDLSETNLNTAKFTDAETDAPDLISYAIPRQPASDAPVIRDVITDINRSVFGALYQDKDFKFTFSVLQSDKEEDIETISEDDILSYSSNSKPAIANKVEVNYRPFADTLSKEDSFQKVFFDNVPVDQLSGIVNTVVYTAYLHEESDAETYAERLAFLRTNTNTTIQIKGKINLNRFGLGDKVILGLDRLFKRFGGESTLKTALVYGISTDEANATLSVNDFNAMFTRVPAIAPDDAADYGSASASDVAKFGYIVDDITETPNPASDLGLGNNLMG